MNKSDFDKVKQGLIRGAESIPFEMVKDEEVDISKNKVEINKTAQEKKVRDAFLAKIQKISTPVSMNVQLPKKPYGVGYTLQKDWGGNAVPQYNVGRAEILEFIYKKILDKIDSNENVDVDKELEKAEQEVEEINKQYIYLENKINQDKKFDYYKEFNKRDLEIKKILGMEYTPEEELEKTGVKTPIETSTDNNLKGKQNSFDKDKVYKNRTEYEKEKREKLGGGIDKMLSDIIEHDKLKNGKDPTDQETPKETQSEEIDEDEKFQKEQQELADKRNGEINSFIENKLRDKEVLLDKFNNSLDEYLNILNGKKQLEKEVDILESLLKKIKQEELDTKNDNKETISENIDDIVEILKNNKIDQIIVAGNYDKKKQVLKPTADLDTKVASYLLGYLNKKPVGEIFEEGAVTSFVGKAGEGKDEMENVKSGKIYPVDFKDGKFKTSGDGKNISESKAGVRVILDTGGEWMKIVQNGEEKTIYIDHHGSGKREPTSGTKMMYEIMKKAGILEEKPWVKNLVDFVNDIDNLSYIDKTDSKGHRLFTENYLRNGWTATLYAFAENKIPFMGIIKLFESGKIEDYTKSFTKEELEGEIGNISIKKTMSKDGTTVEKEVFLRDFVNMKKINEIQKYIEENIIAIRNITQYNTKNQKLNLESKKLGKIMYQNFRSKHIKKGSMSTPDKKGEMETDVFDKWLGFKIIKSRGMDTMIFWNRKDKEFFINSTKGDLVELARKLNEADPGCVKQDKDVRGLFIFGKINNLTERQFLDILDPEIAKDSKIK